MKIKIYILASLALLTTSCSNWLDVTPKDTIVETELFKEASGYRNALNGVYKEMSSETLYGKELSWGMIDVMGQSYYISNYGGGIGNVYYYYEFSLFNYTHVNTKPVIEAIWSKAYNSIANCNNILGRIATENPNKFKEKKLEQDLIMGEAMALRAILHFDMLRLFAPAPIKNNNNPVIPYYNKYPSRGEERVSATKMLDFVISDLVKAQELVVQFDTLDFTHKMWLSQDFRFQGKNSSSGIAPLADDLFFGYRGYRMNYMAITAMLARVYNYAGKHELAQQEAKKVIEFQDKVFGRMFIFTLSANVDGNRKLSSDLIFTLSSPKLYENYQPYTVDEKGSGAKTLCLNRGSSMFDDGADYRKTKLVNLVNGMDYYPNKNIAPAVRNDKSDIVADMLPMIRLSEMWYIVAEYEASKSNFVGAKEALDEVRAARGCTKGRLQITDYTTFKTELLKEVAREFFSEGQLFFYHKKLDVKFSTRMKDESFYFPLPDNENIN